jgi:transposase
MTKRKRYSAEFKAKVALEAIREELTTAELAKKYDIHPTMISGWKRTAIENMAAAFGGASPAAPQISAGEVEKLHAKIGQLVIERDASQRLRGPTGATVAASMSAASSLILGTGGKKR